MSPSRTRGAYRKEDRVGLPTQLQRELVERAAMGAGSCKALAGLLGRAQVLGALLHDRAADDSGVTDGEDAGEAVHDADLERRVRRSSVLKDRTWANTTRQDHREMCRRRVRCPPRGAADGTTTSGGRRLRSYRM